jgi:hypothetical protein
MGVVVLVMDVSVVDLGPVNVWVPHLGVAVLVVDVSVVGLGAVNVWVSKRGVVVAVVDVAIVNVWVSKMGVAVEVLDVSVPVRAAPRKAPAAAEMIRGNRRMHIITYTAQEGLSMCFGAK